VVASQAYVIVLGKGSVNDEAVARGAVRGPVGTSESSRTLLVCPVVGDEVRGRMSDASFSADPFAALAPVVVPVERQAVAVSTERMALRIIATCEASEEVLVAGVVADLDRAQGVEGMVDKEQDFIIPFSGIGKHL